MIFVALAEAAQRGTLLLVDGGMLRYHRRRDGVYTIREILVLPTHRRRGIGRRLVGEVITRAAHAAVQARCPDRPDYAAANAFWRAMGFALLETREGVNLWQRPRQA